MNDLITCPECDHSASEDDFNPDDAVYTTFFDCPECSHSFDWGDCQ